MNCVRVFSLAPRLIQPCQPPLLGGSSTQRILADPGRGGRKRATTDAQKRRRPTPARSSRQHPVAQLPGSKADGVRKDAKWGGLPALRRRLLVNCDGSKDDTSFHLLITLLQVRKQTKGEVESTPAAPQGSHGIQGILECPSRPRSNADSATLPWLPPQNTHADG